MDNLKELTCNNIRAALEDYFRHVDSDDVYENITDSFVDRLADDAIKAKHALRELFSKSQPSCQIERRLRQNQPY